MMKTMLIGIGLTLAFLVMVACGGGAAPATPSPAAAAPMLPTETAAPLVSPTPELGPHITHTVQAGDTMLGIAYQYEITLEALEAANPAIVAELMQIGDEIVVPLPADSPFLASNKPEGPTASNNEGAESFSTCAQGCEIPPDPGCAIKGVVDLEGQRLYYTYASEVYTDTIVKVENGDRWFCTIQEAMETGFRPSP